MDNMYVLYWSRLATRSQLFCCFFVSLFSDVSITNYYYQLSSLSGLSIKIGPVHHSSYFAPVPHANDDGIMLLRLSYAVVWIANIHRWL